MTTFIPQHGMGSLNETEANVGLLIDIIAA